MGNKKYKPRFVIYPYELAEDKRIRPSDMALYGTIYYFERMKYGLCIASNKELARISKLSIGSVRNSLSRLNKLGYITTIYETQDKNIRKRIECNIVFTNKEIKDNYVETE